MKYSFLLFCWEKKKKETDDPAFIIDQKRKIYLLTFSKCLFIISPFALVIPSRHSQHMTVSNRLQLWEQAHNTVSVCTMPTAENGIETSSSATRRT
jgi:hypothetical protein